MIVDGPPPPPPPPPQQWPQPPASPPPGPPPWATRGPGLGSYWSLRGSARSTSGVQWPLLITGFIPLVLALLPVYGLGILSSTLGLVIFGLRARVPYLRKTALIGIGLCLVALAIAIAKTTLLQPNFG